MGNMLKRVPLALLIVLSVALIGCSGGSEEEERIAGIQRALKRADQIPDLPMQIHLLRIAYDDAMSLKDSWPDSAVVNGFLEDYEAALSVAPARVYELALQARDLKALDWAVARGAELDLSHESLKKFWGFGRAWKIYFAGEYEEEALPVFMELAIENGDVRFFDRYAKVFKQKGFRIAQSADSVEPSFLYFRFVIHEIDKAIEREDTERVKFLLELMPRRSDVIYMDDKAKERMRALGQYIFHELCDEELACVLVGLGYEFDRVEIEKTGFGADFMGVLKADPENTITNVLKLDEWHGELFDQEVDLLSSLDKKQLRLVCFQYVDEVVEAYIRRKQSDQAIRLMSTRANIRSYTFFEHKKLIECAIASNNMEMFDHVQALRPEINIYNIDLVALASNYDLFTRYAPQLFRRIHRTMNREPRKDGTTLGRIFDVLASDNHKASFWILERVKLQEIWGEFSEGRTLLMDVCHAGNLEVARYLIEKKGADVSAHTGYVEMKMSVFGQTKAAEGKLSPIFFAAASGNSDLIRYLVSRGANVNARSAFNATPLMYAASNNHLEAVETLISLGAHVNARMKGVSRKTMMLGITAFEKAQTAYDRAQLNENREMMEMLKRAGARP